MTMQSPSPVLQNPFTSILPLSLRKASGMQNPFTARVPLREGVAAISSETSTCQGQDKVSSRVEKLRHLCSNKKEIVVYPEHFVQFKAVELGSSVNESLVIENYSEKDVILEEIIVQGVQNVCTFVAETVQPPEADSILAIIEPGGTCVIKIKCIPHMLGRTLDILLLRFAECEIGRVLKACGISGETSIVSEIRIKEPGLGQYWRKVEEMTLSRMLQETPLDFVPGINPLRSPFFESKRIKRRRVPKYLKTIVAEADDEELLRTHPCITEDLNIENYLDKFRIALWLEELQSFIIRRQYDLANVTLECVGEYLKFGVSGLKDIRPPVLVGDQIFIVDFVGAKRYQAFIYEIRGDEVYTKLAEEFMTKCCETPVGIQFCQGRSLYVRCHYATEQAIEYLGPDWLFPNVNFEFKKPRIPYRETNNGSSLNVQSCRLADRNAEPILETAENVKKVRLFRKRPSYSPYPGQKAAVFSSTGGRTLNKRMGSVMTPFKSDTRGPSGTVKYLTWYNTALNKEQKDAVRGILRGECRPLPYVIFGPPGTGKTVTVVEAILQVYKLDRNSRILVVAPANAAADRIAEQLASSGQFVVGDFVRLVGFLRTEPQTPGVVRPFCVDGQHIAKVASYRLIVSTCTTSGQFHQLDLDDGHFTHVFIDEAGYCTEPEALISASLVAKDKAGQLILAGDPQQLGPVLLSDAAKICGLELSLLERMMNHEFYSRDEEMFPEEHYNPAAITKLVKNYRAHPILIKLPSKLFYDEELEAAADEESVNLYQSLEFMKQHPTPLLFHGVQGTCAREKTSPSYYNTAEILQVIQYVRQLRNEGVENKDIGIITPYRKQCEKIRKALQLTSRGDANIPRVGSIEEFQGGERQVVILSLVRSKFMDDERDEDNYSPRDQLSFIFSKKRFNVAVTRAKSLLIVIGNPHVLVHDEAWNAFMKYSIELGGYTGCNLPSTLESYVPMFMRQRIAGEVTFPFIAAQESPFPASCTQTLASPLTSRPNTLNSARRLALLDTPQSCSRMANSGFTTPSPMTSDSGFNSPLISPTTTPESTPSKLPFALGTPSASVTPPRPWTFSSPPHSWPTMTNKQYSSNPFLTTSSLQAQSPQRSFMKFFSFFSKSMSMTRAAAELIYNRSELDDTYHLRGKFTPTMKHKQDLDVEEVD